MEKPTEKFESKNNTASKKKTILALLVLTLAAAGIVGFFYWQATKNQIYTDNALVSAPTIALSSTTGGELKALFVKEGDMVPANFTVAEIGNEMVTTATPGLVIQVKNSLGENFTPGEPVVTIINPQDLRVDAQVEEDKGLADIKTGQRAVFTVDAFGSKKFYGIVDEVSPTSHATDVVFNISDQRQENNFDVKIRFNTDQYPELKNGMSAKVWISTK